MKRKLIASQGLFFILTLLGFTLIFLIGVGFLQVHVKAESASSKGQTLQQMIDQTKSGGKLVVPSGTYEENVSITKPIWIQAENTVQIRNLSAEPAIQIQSIGVHLEGIQIIQSSDEQSAAVLVNANDSVLEKLDIRTRTFGVVLRDSDRNEIRDNQILWIEHEGHPTVKLSDKRNGIDLYNAHDNRIDNNRISNMNDGIYLENSHRNIVDNNRIDHSRYGVHCMYTNGTIVRNNVGSFNITGAMVMGVNDAQVMNNTFVKQSENVNSQGILLFDVQTSQIYNNRVEGNRIGFYIELSNRNEIRNNDVVQNFVGVQFLESSENQFSDNRFIGNVIETETTDSEDNRFDGNFWEAFHGIDIDGDGASDLSYAMNPFFQRMTKAIPAFQIFFQSPGMIFLENMFTTDQTEWSMDHAPLMKPTKVSEPEQSTSRRTSTSMMLLSLLLLAASSTIIYYLGVKRT